MTELVPITGESVAVAIDAAALATDVPRIRDQNNFGFLRLFFAVLVILSHAPEMLDGNRSRELLTRAFGTMSFGEVAVDGFFLISGYLITKSWLRSQTPTQYLKKRLRRIYPGFIVAFLICLLVFDPLGGGGIPFRHNIVSSLGKLIINIPLLQAPETGAAFSGLHYQAVNGAIWTIIYEFRCYLAVMVVGSLGLFRQRKLVVLIAAALLLAIPLTQPGNVSPWHSALVGTLHNDARLFPASVWHNILVGTLHDEARFFSAFAVGCLFLLFRERIRFPLPAVLASAALMLCAMPFPLLAEPALILCGGYCLFWFALHAKVNALSKIDDRWDVSYGTYLYGWPLTTLIIWYVRGISPWLLFLLATPLAIAFGLLSWLLIESRFLPTKARFPRNG